MGSDAQNCKMGVGGARAGWLRRLGGGVCAREDVAEPKRGRDVYLKAAAEAGIPPGRCVVVEDSPSGARAGKAAGMVCLGYVAQTDPARLDPICDALFDAMRDLPGMLGLPARV